MHMYIYIYLYVCLGIIGFRANSNPITNNELDGMQDFAGLADAAAMGSVERVKALLEVRSY